MFYDGLQTDRRHMLGPRLQSSRITVVVVVDCEICQNSLEEQLRISKTQQPPNAVYNFWHKPYYELNAALTPLQ